MGDLTKNFSLKEFSCPCCGEANVDARLIQALQALRDLAGLPIRVLSGYRCPKQNSKISGAPKSQHMLGKAADIVIFGLKPLKMLHMAEEIEAFRDGGIGLYSKEGFIHVDVREERTRWGRLDGEYVRINQ